MTTYHLFSSIIGTDGRMQHYAYTRRHETVFDAVVWAQNMADRLGRDRCSFWLYSEKDLESMREPIWESTNRTGAAYIEKKIERPAASSPVPRVRRRKSIINILSAL